MKVKLSIMIFMIILSVFYFQIISCKSNEEPNKEPNEPIYSNYTGTLLPNPYMPSMYDIIEHSYRRFEVDTKQYSIMVQSDIDKLNDIPIADYIGRNITIRATYSNSYFGHKRGYDDDYLFDISIISLGE